MEIKNISVDFLSVDNNHNENYIKKPIVAHTMIKYSPYFSIVQIEGNTIYGAAGDGEEISLSDGATMIFPSNTRQLLRREASLSPINARMQWLFAEIVINKKYRLDDLYAFPECIPAEDEKAVGSLMRQMVACNGDEKKLCDQLSLMYKLIKILLNCATPKKNVDTSVLRALDYVKKHYKEPIKVADLAQAANMSESNFFRIFKRTMKISPTAYINDYRLLMASTLLETTDLKVGSVSEKVGFKEQYYFSKRFLKRFGMSPLQYRKNSRENF